MTDEEKQVPGVTFYFRGASLMKPNAAEKYRVHLQLDAAVDDEDLWKLLEERFKAGYRIYRSLEFHEEVIRVMAQKSRDLESELAKERAARKTAEDAVARYKALLARFEADLSG